MPSAIVSAIAAVYGAYTAKRAGDRSELAAQNAAEAQLTANDQSLAAAQDLFNQQVAISAENASTAQGFLRDGADAGTSLLAPLAQQSAPLISKFLGQIDSGEFNQGDFNFSFNPDDAGFQFLLDQSLDAVDSRANASGLLNSGGRLKELHREAEGFTNSFINDAFNRQSGEFQINANENANEFARAQAGANIGLGSIGALSDIQVGLGQGLANAQLGLGSQQLAASNSLGLATQNAAQNAGAINSGLFTNIAGIQNNTDAQVANNVGSALGAFSSINFNNSGSGGTIAADGSTGTFG